MVRLHKPCFRLEVPPGGGLASTNNSWIFVFVGGIMSRGEFLHRRDVLSVVCPRQAILRECVTNNLASAGIEGRVFRSDSKEGVSNSYVLLENESSARSGHFDVRTDDRARFDSRTFRLEPTRFPFMHGFHSRMMFLARILAMHKPRTMAWWRSRQRKSRAFLQIVTIKGFSVETGWARVKDFDLFCK